MKTIRTSRILPYPPEMVWAALTDSDQMAEWLMENDFRPEVGHDFEFRTKPAPGFDGIVKCTVLAVEPNRRLQISWVGGGIDTVVTFSLTPRGDGTELQIVHDGFGLRNLLPRVFLGLGWRSILGKKLPASIAAHRTGAPR